jgi:hypothetical protein
MSKSPPTTVSAFLMPSFEELALAQQVNDALPPHARVQPYRVDAGDDSIRYGMVFEYFSARKPVEREYPFFDADAVVKEVKEWIKQLEYQRKDAWEIAR